MQVASQTSQVTDIVNPPNHLRIAFRQKLYSLSHNILCKLLYNHKNTFLCTPLHSLPHKSIYNHLRM